MIRILIADDHAVVREGLKGIINRHSDMKVVDEASEGNMAIEKIESSSFDIIVLDISLPDQSGIEILKELKARNVETPVLVLSMHPEEQYAIRVLKAGAAGYLTKESAPDELVTAIRKVYEGGNYITGTLAEKLAFDLRQKSGKLPHETLSDREFEVLYLIARGKSVTEIALKFSLSVKTVSTYRARVLHKMNLKNNAEIIHYAIAHELI